MSAGGALSLRRRLWLAGAGGVVAVAVVAGWLLGEAFRRSVEHGLDRRLEDDFATVAGLVEADGGGGWRLRREPADERYAGVFSGWYWQVGDGDARAASRSLWDAGIPMPSAAGAPWRFADGPRGQALRVHQRQLRMPGVSAPVTVAVAGDRADIAASVREFRLLATLAVGAATALLLLLAWQVRWGLRPLARMREVLASMRGDAGVRFGEAGWPAEVAPLAREIDVLLDEHARRVERARHAAQDLAHELKTPLAVLAAEGERPGPEIAAVVAEQVARMRAAVERRLATGFAGDARQRTDVAAEVGALVAMFAAMPRDAAVGFSHAVDDGAVFAGSREDFVEMLGNLVDNAAKWARTRVRVGVARDGGGLEVAVSDDGAGIPAGRIDDALRRGTRLDERTPGSGLGLAIVRQIAESYGGRLRLRNLDGGFRASLWLPAP